MAKLEAPTVYLPSQYHLPEDTINVEVALSVLSATLTWLLPSAKVTVPKEETEFKKSEFHFSKKGRYYTFYLFCDVAGGVCQVQPVNVQGMPR